MVQGFDSGFAAKPAKMEIRKLAWHSLVFACRARFGGSESQKTLKPSPLKSQSPKLKPVKP